jgi:hypothetical protein
MYKTFVSHPNDPIQVEDSERCYIYQAVVAQICKLTKPISSANDLPLRFEDHTPGMCNGMTYVLEPKTDLPYLFIALALPSEMDARDVPQSQEQLQAIYTLLRNTVKASMDPAAYKLLQTFKTRALRDGDTFELAFPALCALLKA